MLQQFKKIIELGISPETDLWLAGKIKVVNAISLLTTFMLLTFIVIDQLTGANPLLLAVLTSHTLIMLTPFYLNYKKRYIASRAFFLVASYIGICLMAIFFGEALYFQYYLVPGVGMSLIFFRDEIGNKKWLFTLAGIPLWAMLEYWFHTASPLIVLQAEYLHILSYLSSFLIFITTIIMFAVFTHESDSNLAKLKQVNDELNTMAKYDALTGLPNRHFLTQQLNHFFNMARRQQDFFAFCIVDIDFFKAINDQYGHDAGDHVLQQFSLLLQQNFRDIDLLGRVGGEEFCIAFYGAQQDTKQALERCRKNLENLVIYYGNNTINITASFGIAYYQQGLNDFSHLYKNADQALYKAKQTGRNKVCEFH